MSAELSSQADFSVICSFFNKFGSFLGLKPIPFTRLEAMLSFDAEGRPDKALAELHVQLLRRAGQKGASVKKWEACLLKYLAWDPSLDEEERTVERFGYAHAPLATKLAILKRLCERQFDWNPKLREAIQGCSARDLRLLPVGHDAEGRSYWYQQDAAPNIRIYSEEPDDDAGRSWTLQANHRQALADLIQRLDGGPGEAASEAKEEEEREITEEEALNQGSPSTSAPTTTSKGEEETSSKSQEPGGASPESSRPGAEVKEEPSDNSLSKDGPEKEDETKSEPDKDSPEKEEETKSEPSKDSPEKEEEEEKEKAKPLPKRVTATLTKRGATLDTFQEAKPKAKEVASLAASGNETPANASGEESIDPDNLPEDLKPFIERRILPRRSTRSANTNFKHLNDGTSPRKPAKEPAEEKKKTPTPAKEEAVAKKERGNGAGLEEEASEEDWSGSDDSEDSDDDFVPLSALKKPGGSGKRRRRRRKAVDFDDCDSDVEGGEERPRKARKLPTSVTHCGRCHKSTQPEVLLLCDACDDAWHTWCLRPPLWYVPDEDWFCPKCQHGFLLAKLRSALAALDQELARKEEERLKKEADSAKRRRQAERLKREMDFIGISLNNIIGASADSDEGGKDEEDDGDEEEEEEASASDSEEERRRRRKRRQREPPVPIAVGRTKRRRQRVDYTFNEFDEMVTEAVEELLEGPETESHPDPARPSGGLGRGKDMANIIQAEKEREGSEGSGERIAKAKIKAKPKLTDLDEGEAAGEEDSEYEEEEKDSEEAAASESEFEPDDDDEDEEEYLPRSARRATGTRRSTRLQGPTQSDEDFVASDSSEEYLPTKKAQKAKAAAKKRRRRYVASDESEDSLLEGRGRSDSEEEDSDSDWGAKKRKKASAGGGGRTRGRRVNYKKLVDSSEEDEEEEEEEEEDGKEKEKEGSGNEDEDAPKPKKLKPLAKPKSDRPTGAFRRNKIESDDEDYKEEQEDSNDSDEEEEEEEKSDGKEEASNSEDDHQSDGESEEEEAEKKDAKKSEGSSKPPAKEESQPPKAEKSPPVEATQVPSPRTTITNGGRAVEEAKAASPSPSSPATARIVQPIPHRASPLSLSHPASPALPSAFHPTGPPPPLPSQHHQPLPYTPPPLPSHLPPQQPSALASLEAMKPMGFQPTPTYYQPQAQFAAPSYQSLQPATANSEGLSAALSSAMQEESQEFHQL